MLQKVKIESFNNLIDNERLSNEYKIISYEVDAVREDYVVKIDNLKYRSVTSDKVYSVLEKVKRDY